MGKQILVHFVLETQDNYFLLFEKITPHPITNLNILLYQTNLDYRCNHQSIQVKLEQKLPRLDSCKFHNYHSKTEQTLHGP